MAKFLKSYDMCIKMMVMIEAGLLLPCSDNSNSEEEFCSIV